MPTKSFSELSADAAVLISHFAQQPKGALVSYDDIARLIGYDVRENRSIIQTVARRLRKDDGRVLDAVATKGYKVLTDDEVANGVLRREREKRCRNARVAKEKAATVDFAALSEPARIKVLAEVTTAHLTIEASREKAVTQISSQLNGSNAPLAMNLALEAIKRSLTKQQPEQEVEP